MNPNSAPGDDGMYAKYIMELRCFLVEPLKLLFRQSLSKGKIPEDLKKGLIVPIYKKNKTTEFKNLAPYTGVHFSNKKQ